MLMILFTRDVVSINELAEELETNKRNIPEYRKELEAAGYSIETVSGRYGGYSLKKNNFFPTVRLTDAEKKALVDSFEYITKQKNFPSMPAYKTAMEKMMAANHYRSVNDSEMIMIAKQPLSMPEEDIVARYAAISQCIERRQKLKMNYRSNDNVVRERLVHPYKLYMYNNAWFMLAYCEAAKDIRYFKLNRIIKFECQAQKFDFTYSYREGSEWHEWLDENEMKKVPDWIQGVAEKNAPMQIKLRLFGKPAMYVKEFLYGANQSITEIDKDTTILEFTAKYKYNTLQLVLGFGADCEVLEPEWLKQEVVDHCKKIQKIYN